MTVDEDYAPSDSDLRVRDKIGYDVIRLGEIIVMVAK